MDGRIAAYRTADTMGKSQVDLILTVYDGAISSLRAAAKHFSDGETDQGYEELLKVKKFVTHLYSTLDQEKGGEVVENLGKLYVWVLSQLYVLEAAKDPELFESTLTVLTNLRSGWADLKSQLSQPTDNESQPEKDQPGSRQTLDKFVTTA